MMQRFFLVVTIAACLQACTSPKQASESQQQAIADACGSLDYSEIKKVDDIGEACKAALADLLPAPQNNLANRLFNLGSDFNGSKTRLILSGVDASGKALTAESLQELDIAVTLNGLGVTLPKSAYTIKRALDEPADRLSIAQVGDYSGSMNDDDIALVGELFGAFTRHLTPIADFEVLYFSETVVVQQPFTADANLLTAALQKNAGLVRSSTALYDAMGKGAEDLATSSRMGQLLVVGTDGMENSSTRYTRETLSALLASNKKLAVLMMGTFLSDSKEMEDLVGSRGAYVYAPNIKAGKASIEAFAQAMQEAVVIEVSELYQNASGFRATLGTASAAF